MPPKPRQGGKNEAAKKKRKKGAPQPPNPKGTRHMVLGANGKIRFEWR